MRNSLFTVSAVFEGETTGIGRLAGDGAMYWYLQEIIVLPAYQGKGIGTGIVKRLLTHVQENKLSGVVTVRLIAAKGKEPFYKKFGFFSLPNGKSGSGMKKYIR